MGKLQVLEKLCEQNTLTCVPFIADSALDDYAQKVVGVFAPSCLKEPSPFDIEAFLLFGLELTILRHHINIGGKSLAVTAFNDGFMQVCGADGRKVRPILVERGTVVVDKTLYLDGNVARLRFTYAHEAAHWLLHRKFFTDGRESGKGGVGCGQVREADKARVEWQANFLAAALLMPKPALRMACADFFRGTGQNPRALPN